MYIQFTEICSLPRDTKRQNVWSWPPSIVLYKIIEWNPPIRNIVKAIILYTVQQDISGLIQGILHVKSIPSKGMSVFETASFSSNKILILLSMLDECFSITDEITSVVNFSFSVIWQFHPFIKSFIVSIICFQESICISYLCCEWSFLVGTSSRHACISLGSAVSFAISHSLAFSRKDSALSFKDSRSLTSNWVKFSSKRIIWDFDQHPKSSSTLSNFASSVSLTSRWIDVSIDVTLSRISFIFSSSSSFLATTCSWSLSQSRIKHSALSIWYFMLVLLWSQNSDNLE